MWEHWSLSTVYETDQDQPASCHNTAMSLVNLSNGITSTFAGKSKQKPTSHAIVSLLEVVIYERQQLMMRCSESTHQTKIARARKQLQSTREVSLTLGGPVNGCP